MFCRICGKEVPQDARFCSGCGAPVADPVSTSQPIGDARPRDPLKWVIIGLVVAIVIVAACIVVPYSEDVPERTHGNVTIRGDLVRDDIFIVGDGLQYDGTDCVWHFKDLHAPHLVGAGSVYLVRGHDSVEGQVLSPGPGEYEVILNVNGADVAEGHLVVRGTIADTYSWTAVIDGEVRSFTVDYDYTLDEFLGYAHDDVVRWQVVSLSDARFVTVDAPVQRLVNALADGYRAVYGRDVSLTDQRYADYLLSFVQCYITYPPTVSSVNGSYVWDDAGNGDIYLYGEEEYWAYPLETLHTKQGDCEDTTILLCAIYSAAGFGSAMVTVPEHMLAGVELEGFQPRVNNPGLVFTAKRIPDHEFNLYFCETTFKNAVPVGYVSQSVSRDISTLEEVTYIPPYDHSREVPA